MSNAIAFALGLLIAAILCLVVSMMLPPNLVAAALAFVGTAISILAAGIILVELITALKSKRKSQGQRS